MLLLAINSDGDGFGRAGRACADDIGPPLLMLFDSLEVEYLGAADPLGVSRSLDLTVPAGKIFLSRMVAVDLGAVKGVFAQRKREVAALRRGAP